MGGRPKGWLLAPLEASDAVASAPRMTLVERTLTLARAHCAEVLLVGRAGAYADLGVEAVADATTTDGVRAEGPLAGLVGLLERAREATVIALACDMPYVTSAMLARLVDHAPDAPAVAAREAGARAIWSPLFARYDASRVRSVARAKLDAGERSLRAVLESIETCELPLTLEERRALRDWDSPSDIDDPSQEWSGS
jgi:molybdopterin-guanine dinucleotide biosynthesis protein A